MDFDRYLESLRSDAALLGATARRDLGAPAPACPDWTVTDVVDHVAAVYRHKIACMRLGRAPESMPDPPPGDPVDRMTDSLDELVTELTTRGPLAPSYTWHQPDQTVAFWYRRMAQETAVHRVDVQLAFGPAGPIDGDIAVDGVDEVLEIMLAGDWSDLPQPGPQRRIQLDAGNAVREVTLRPTSVSVVRSPAGPAETTVRGGADQILLWLWGRTGLDGLQVGGDTAGATALRDRLRLVTQ
jgi:uncharacterized protein (TIGR03083 family)